MTIMDASAGTEPLPVADLRPHLEQLEATVAELVELRARHARLEGSHRALHRHVLDLERALLDLTPLPLQRPVERLDP